MAAPLCEVLPLVLRNTTLPADFRAVCHLLQVSAAVRQRMHECEPVIDVELAVCVASPRLASFAAWWIKNGSLVRSVKLNGLDSVPDRAAYREYSQWSGMGYWYDLPGSGVEEQYPTLESITVCSLDVVVRQFRSLVSYSSNILRSPMIIQQLSLAAGQLTSLELDKPIRRECAYPASVCHWLQGQKGDCYWGHSLSTLTGLRRLCINEPDSWVLGHNCFAAVGGMVHLKHLELLGADRCVAAASAGMLPCGLQCLHLGLSNQYTAEVGGHNSTLAFDFSHLLALRELKMLTVGPLCCQNTRLPVSLTSMDLHADVLAADIVRDLQLTSMTCMQSLHLHTSTTFADVQSLTGLSWLGELSLVYDCWLDAVRACPAWQALPCVWPAAAKAQSCCLDARTDVQRVAKVMAAALS